ncbi:deoxycytidyl transferase [Coniothyrium glycines]
MGSRLDKNSEAVRKRIANHTFDGEEGDEYGGSAFGGFTDYFRRKKIKLQNLDADIRARAGSKPQIFKGIVAHVNGYTQPSLNDLHTLIVEHGGGFMQYLDGKTTVTHIVASSLTPKKVIEFRRYRIVKPAWVVDSIQAGKLLPWNEYRVVDEGEKQNVLTLDKGKGITSQANVKLRGYRDQTDASWYTSQLLGSQAGPASTPTSSGSVRSRFSKQAQPTPHDDIEDLPPSRQPDHTPAALISRKQNKSRATDTSSQTIPLSTMTRLAEEPVGVDNHVPHDHHDIRNTHSPRPRAQLIQHENGTYDEVYESGTPPPGERQLTAEEHNAILLRDPKLRKSTVVDPNFLEQYYRESRLHHLSTWKADLKSQLQALASEQSASQKARQRRPLGARRYVLHIDFDSFFAAVSLIKNPQFKEKPAVVAHGQGSGSEIASCNYPARKFGVKNGMWMKRALELCPDLKILPYDFPAYEDASRAFYESILATGGVVQSVSVDEALIDVTNLCIAVGGTDGRKYSEGSDYREQAKADDIAKSLRDEVKVKTGCDVSVGIGGNILLAKVALRRAKPAGQYQIKSEEVLDFLGELQVQDLPGVAWSIGGKLEEVGVRYVKDIRELSKEKLIQTLGPKTGEKLYEYSRGIDRQEVGEQVIRKSVSAEVNWGVRFENQDQADEFIASLCGELQKRLLKEKVKGRQFTMKIMRRSPDAPLDPPKHLGHGKCDTHNKSLLLGVATNAKEVFTKEALAILRGFGFSPGELRGIGIQVTKLEPMKSATDGHVGGSQRRLQFKAGATNPANNNQPPKMLPEDSIHDNFSITEQKEVDRDPIQDDPETPKKPRELPGENHVAFGAEQLNHSTPSRRPLNTLGTQFILPSQVDPKVLAELPADIRSKLLRQTQRSSSSLALDAKIEDNSDIVRSRTPTKVQPFTMTALPAQSQLDPDILAALPPEVRDEVLAQYEDSVMPMSPSRRPRHADQTLLPQSPRKNRIIGIPAKKTIAPVKRGRGRPPRSAMLAAAAQATSLSKTGKTLTQANFISLKNPARDSRSRETSTGPLSADDVLVETSKGQSDDELDPDFLAVLPEEVRKELIEEHKRKKLNNFHLAVTRKNKMPAVGMPVQKLAQVITIPRPRKPTFTAQRLFREENLRSAMKNWVEEFDDEGPYEEDVAALVRYLKQVVLDERDLRKAVGVVQWLEYIVGELVDKKRDRFAEEKWRLSMETIKAGIRAAAKHKGVGVVSFD